jgi:DNA-binding beta-propeller fold protein YncE
MDGACTRIAATWRGTRVRRLVLPLLALAGASVVCNAPASALPAQGHEFAGTFEGTGAQKFEIPGGVAVNEASGEVYVSDPAHERVERFKPAGGGYQFGGEFKVPLSGAIAIDDSSDSSDPSSGDIYVAGAGSAKEAKEQEQEAKEQGKEPERNYLYKFTASGETIFKKRIFKATEKKEESGEKVVEQVEKELERISGLAVDATGKLWVYWGESGNINGFSDDETNKLIPSLGKEEVLAQSALESGCQPAPGFAVGPADEVFYVAHERENGVEGCPGEEGQPSTTVVSQLAGTGEATVRSLDNRDSPGVALDQADGDVYIDNVSSVAAFGPKGSFIQRFGSEELSGGGALAIDSAQGVVYVAEPGKVAVFTREGAGAPTIDSVSAQPETPSSERVKALIDPRGAKTSYYVQYGTVSCLERESSCTDEPAPPGEGIGEGYGDVSVQATLEALRANTTYYYRVVAHNEHGTTDSPLTAQTFFTTLPSSEGVLLDHREWELVSPVERHGATPEPISEEGALIQAAADGNSIAWTARAPFTSQAEGTRAPEPVQAISTRGGEEWSSKDITTPRNSGEGVGAGEPTEYRFFSSDLSLAVVQPQVLGGTLENPPLAPGAREKTIYERNDESGEFEALVTATTNDPTGEAFGAQLDFVGASADARHVVFLAEVPLVSGAGQEGLYEWEAGAPLKFLSALPMNEHAERTPAPAPQLGYNGLDLRGAISQEGSRVFWTNEEEKGGAEGPLYMSDTATGETIQINAAAPGVREAGPEEIEDKLDEVHFQAASSDGSRVFFTDTWPLTSESNLEPTKHEQTEHEEPLPADLYEFNVETHKLTDLTVARNVGERTEVLGTLPGISEDGSYVYFVANGVLAPGAEKRGTCPREDPFHVSRHFEGECNLYVSEPDPGDPAQRETRFIARLSDEDAADWGEGQTAGIGNLGGLTSQVSGNGRYLAFMSNRNLTGYENVDANPAANGARDEEVFLYDANTARLVCASCNPSGKPPLGVFDTENAGEGKGLTVDRPLQWKNRWLAASIPGWTRYEFLRADHQSRYLSNDGRLFFNSADALVEQVQTRTRDETIDGTPVKVGVENVYEYEPEGIGSCQQAGGCVALISSGTSEQESAFLDASESGNDVFFLTAAQLVAQETETGDDIYDARSCGTAETGACLPVKKTPPAPCAGEECRAAVSGHQSFELPPSFIGPPAQQQVESPKKEKKAAPKPLTRAQKLANALKACHRLKQKKRRVACERKARKAYSARAGRGQATARKTASSKRKRR